MFDDFGNDYKEQEKTLWQQATSRVKPLRKKKERILKQRTTKAKIDIIDIKARIPIRDKYTHDIKQNRLPELKEGESIGIDKNTAKKLREGKIIIEEILDLHGKTQIEAITALNLFMEKAYQQGKRCVLIVTGAGVPEKGTGIIRKQLPKWLNEQPMREKILMFATAKKHGKKGAFYVLLKRNR